MKKQLFTWEDWMSLGNFSWVFYEVVLKVKVGKYEVGTKFSSASISYEDSTLTFFDKNGNVLDSFQLKLIIV